MDNYKLHYFPESGNSYKLALMLKLCGQDFEPIWTDFGGGVTRTMEWRKHVNEMGEIPVLEDDGVKLTQTAPILIRLAKRYNRLYTTDPKEEFEILRWLFWDNHKLTGYMAPYRFQRTFTPSAIPSVLEFLQKRIDDCLNILDVHLDRNPFAIGQAPTIADISMLGYLSFPPSESGYDLRADYPNIGSWLERIAALPGWQGPYDLLPGKRLPHYV